MDVDAAATIALTGTYNPDSLNGTVTVTIYTESDPGLTNLKLRVALHESGIYYNAPYGPDIHNQTFRDMIPTATGQSVTLTVGDTISYTFPFATPSPIRADSCELVAFIQSDTGHRIVQAAKVSVGTFLNPSGVNDGAEMPKEFALQQNYPNPFNAETSIGFNTKGGQVKLEVFDITGSKVTTLVNGDLASGHHSLIWNGRDSHGRAVSSGVYFYRLSDSAGSQVRRMTLMK